MDTVSFEEDSFSDNASYTDNDLKRVANLAKMQQQQEKRVTLLEEELKKAKNELRTTREKDLPDLMKEIGLSQVVLQDGSRVEIREDMYASIANKNKAAACQWLIDNEHASLVKTDIEYVFDRGDRNAAENFAKFLESNGYSEYSITEIVNTGSVKAAIKEMIANGVDVPLELFGVHFVTQSVIK